MDFGHNNLYFEIRIAFSPLSFYKCGLSHYLDNQISSINAISNLGFRCLLFRVRERMEKLLTPVRPFRSPIIIMKGMTLRKKPKAYPEKGSIIG